MVHEYSSSTLPHGCSGPPFEQSVGLDDEVDRPFSMPLKEVEAAPAWSASSSSSQLIPGHPLNTAGSVTEWLEQELDVTRLNIIHNALWWVGRLGNIRPLHRQRMMHREILPTEDISLHLVWHENTIYVKPLPACLLSWRFYRASVAPHSALSEAAAGLLLTYVRLVAHRSDFRVAVAHGLLPECLCWDRWCTLAASLYEHLVVRRAVPINKRYHYGELRLPRLNHLNLLYGRRRWLYYSTYSQYSHFFTKHFAWVAIAFAFFTVILDAMQVVLSTSSPPAAFDAVSYRFGYITIVLILSALITVMSLFLGLFIYFLVVTLRARAQSHLRDIHTD